jgi:acyl carrier protein
MSSIQDRVREFIRENFLYMRPNFQLENADPLLGNGVIDSLGVMELITFLEEQFAIQVADAEVTEDNLGSINAIARYVQTKRGAMAA